MFKIIVSDEIKNICPDFVGIAIYGAVNNTHYSEALWEQINSFVSEYKAFHIIENIKKQPTIAATRAAYKKLGKDPNRYRPSSEALLRRILRDLPLYQIDTLVDLINLVSIKTGYSIGGFDADKIEGTTLTLGVGKPDEPYEGIGRGLLNIEGIPVYRDSIGGIGTPTSDNERTKLSIETTRILTIINGYNGKEGLDEAAILMENLLFEYADLKDSSIVYF